MWVLCPAEAPEGLGALGGSVMRRAGAGEGADNRPRSCVPPGVSSPAPAGAADRTAPAGGSGEGAVLLEPPGTADGGGGY